MKNSSYVFKINKEKKEAEVNIGQRTKSKQMPFIAIYSWIMTMGMSEECHRYG